MTKVVRWVCPCFFFGLSVLASIRLHTSHPSPFPHFEALVLKEDGLQDIALLVAGFRDTAADLAWVDLLQYVGGGFTGDPKKGIRPEMSFETVKDRTLRVTRLDPFFHRAYLYGGGILGWFQNVNRPQEALEVLTEGIRYNPNYWPLHTYIAAIAYAKNGQIKLMTDLLEKAVQHPDCPTVTKTVLANAYKKMGRYPEALAIWEKIAETDPNLSERRRAIEEIPKVEALMRGRP